MDSVLVFHVLVISSNAQAEHIPRKLCYEFEPRTATSAATTKATKGTITTATPTTITET